MAKIFITLLTHNNSAFIEASIKSVLNQTFQDWEMLISDDASSDDTYSIIEHLLIDKRINYVYHKKNLKQPKNWTYALKQNNAPIIATLHADDEWTSNTLAEVNSTFDNNKHCDLVWGNWEFFDQEFHPLNKTGPVNSKMIFKNNHEALNYLGKNNHMLPSATFISKEVLEKTGYPNDDLKMLCDREFYLRVLNNVNYCESIPKIVCKYRVNSEGVSSKFTRSFVFYDEIYTFGMDLENLIYDYVGKEKLIIAMKCGLCDVVIQGVVNAKRSKNKEKSKLLMQYLKRIHPSYKISLKNQIKLLLA
jgi:teichuronic acid biosynthesis glycosyltransferase TuaG